MSSKRIATIFIIIIIILVVIMLIREQFTKGGFGRHVVQAGDQNCGRAPRADGFWVCTDGKWSDQRSFVS